MEKLKTYESPLLKNGSIRRGWEEISMGPGVLDPLKPFNSPDLRMAGQPPRVGEVHVGIPVRIFRKIV